jgi:L-ascorbate metabolism protein UlaG (beta-lactamase superfamily)
MIRHASLLILACWTLAATADEHARAYYIANMGAMIERGETKVLFDPLFSNHFDIYDRITPETQSLVIDGIAPFDGVDAVFISHHHADHFDPATILALLRAQTAVELFGPEQAAAAIRALVDDPDDAVLQHVHGLSLENGQAAVDVVIGPLLIEAARVRHSGWPEYHADVENIVFRVTLDGETTVMHFGDADPQHHHYTVDPEHWFERHTHFAMPPYWFFYSTYGREILDERMDIGYAIGMHVPTEVPDEPASRPEKLRDVDLFTNPGESRAIAD